MQRAVLFFLFICFSASTFSNSSSLSIGDLMSGDTYVDVAISPNGKYVAEIHDVDQKRILVIRDLQTPNKKIIGKLSDELIRPYYVSWANDERILAGVFVPFDLASAKRKIK